MIQQTLHYGEFRIPYCVVFAPERERRISIQVTSDGLVKVTAPEDRSLVDIKRAVLNRARWLHAHVARISSNNVDVLPREYVSGESHFYLGKRYLLKIKRSSREESIVRLTRGRLEVTSDDSAPKRIRGLLWSWYRNRARDVFERRLISVCARVPWVNDIPEWKLLTMKRQWGSCSPSGVLCINPHLVKASSLCVDYVLLHELCHLKVHNHSDKFYRLLERQMPRWQEVKTRLDGMAQLLLNC